MILGAADASQAAFDLRPRLFGIERAISLFTAVLPPVCILFTAFPFFENGLHGPAQLGGTTSRIGKVDRRIGLQFGHRCVECFERTQETAFCDDMNIDVRLERWIGIVGSLTHFASPPRAVGNRIALFAPPVPVEAEMCSNAVTIRPTGSTPGLDFSNTNAALLRLIPAPVVQAAAENFTGIPATFGKKPRESWIIRPKLENSPRFAFLAQ